MPPMIVGLDLAVQMGFAYGRAGEMPVSGSVSLRSKSFHDGEKFCLLIDWLYPILRDHKPYRVVYEAPLMTMPKGRDGGGGGSAKTMMALLGYANMVDMLCARMDVQAVSVASSTVRKHFIGNGRHPDPKPEVFAECIRRGWDPIDHNESDALACLDYAHNLYSPNDYRRAYR